jgi:hypothetical protein
MAKNIKKISYRFIILFNGLGNQIGQFSLYLCSARVSSEVYLIPLKNQKGQVQLDEIFNVDSVDINQSFILRYISKLMFSSKLPQFLKNFCNIKGLSKFLIEPPDMSFDMSLICKLQSEKFLFMFGGWHNSEMHESSIELLKKYIRIDKVRAVKNEFRKTTSSYPVVGIHVRGGDYLHGDAALKFGGIATKEYYFKAISHIKSNIPNAVFFIFTDDQNYVLSEFYELDFKFGNAGNGSEDFIRMMTCDALIIGNSSFAYWAARLNETATIITRPSKFTHDSCQEVYPEGWKIIE